VDNLPESIAQACEGVLSAAICVRCVGWFLPDTTNRQGRYI